MATICRAASKANATPGFHGALERNSEAFDCSVYSLAGCFQCHSGKSGGNADRDNVITLSERHQHIRSNVIWSVPDLV